MKRIYQFAGIALCLFTFSCQCNNEFNATHSKDRISNVEFMASMLEETDFVEAKVYFENEALEVKLINFSDAYGTSKAEDKKPDFVIENDYQKLWTGLSKTEVAENVYDYGKISSCIIAQAKADANGKYSLAIKNCL